MSTDYLPAIVGSYYYLYRQAGCPLGDNLAGLSAWVHIQITIPLEKLAEREVNK